ncbi:Uncharacterised protein [uncultured archaeon]|nr:Uncharacterised protein [uncultured archaeon]
MLQALLPIALTFGSINALVPLLIIIILIGAAAGMTRGYDIFNVFGISFIAGIGSGNKGSLRGASAFGAPKPGKISSEATVLRKAGGIRRAVNKTAATQAAKSRDLAASIRAAGNTQYLPGATAEQHAAAADKRAQFYENVAKHTSDTSAMTLLNPAGRLANDIMKRRAAKATEQQRAALAKSLEEHAKKVAQQKSGFATKMQNVKTAVSVITPFGTRGEYNSVLEQLKNPGLSEQDRRLLLRRAERLRNALGIPGPTSAAELGALETPLKKGDLGGVEGTFKRNLDKQFETQRALRRGEIINEGEYRKMQDYARRNDNIIKGHELLARIEQEAERNPNWQQTTSARLLVDIYSDAKTRPDSLTVRAINENYVNPYISDYSHVPYERSQREKLHDVLTSAAGEESKPAAAATVGAGAVVALIGGGPVALAVGAVIAYGVHENNKRVSRMIADHYAAYNGHVVQLEEK